MTQPNAPTSPSTGGPTSASSPVAATPKPDLAGPARTGGGGDGDWTDQVTDLIVDTIDKVRSHTTGPILEVSKGMVYAIVAFVLMVPIALLAVIGLVRFVTIWVPAWAAYLGFGVVFVLIGTLLWSRRGRIPT